jgi:hypothetical protein
MKKQPAYPVTPELDKVKAVHEKAQAIGEFLDIFLSEKGGYSIGRPHKHGPQCGVIFEDDSPSCGYRTGEFEALNGAIEQRLAEFFGIDLKKVERERRQVLDYIQTLNDR